MNNATPSIGDEFGEVLNTRKTFFLALKKESKKIILVIIFASAWSLVCFKFLPASFVSSDLGFYIVILPWFLLLFWFMMIYSKVREAFWKQLALKYKWEYTPHKSIHNEKALLFKIGRPQMVCHGIAGSYNNQPLHIFEYEYTIGSGKNKTTYSFTVFEVKFTGTFPHLYLNYKNDWYSNTPAMFSSLAKISVPAEFEDKFKLYSPKEYEVETLEIFTPEVFSTLLDLEWNHDMEFVDGELVIYRKKRFGNFADLDAELNKIKKFIDLLAPRLNKLKLYQIGNISSSLKM
jgi:hypothetical protein